MGWKVDCDICGENKTLSRIGIWYLCEKCNLALNQWVELQKFLKTHEAELRGEAKHAGE